MKIYAGIYLFMNILAVGITMGKDENPLTVAIAVGLNIPLIGRALEWW